MNFERNKFYSLTDIQKKFKIRRFKLQLLLVEHSLQVIENKITYGNYYSIIAKYYLIEDIEKMML